MLSRERGCLFDSDFNTSPVRSSDSGMVADGASLDLLKALLDNASRRCCSSSTVGWFSDAYKISNTSTSQPQKNEMEQRRVTGGCRACTNQRLRGWL